MNTFKQGKGLVSIEKAKDLIRQWIEPLADFTETIASKDSLGRQLAEDIRAEEDLPYFRKSTMDGYALLAEDKKPLLLYEIVGEAQMGSDEEQTLGTTTAVYVPTGGRLPENANGVIKVEGTRVLGNQLFIEKDSDFGPHWIEKGEDIKKGELALGLGLKMNPMTLGFLSLLGREHISVKKRLKVAIITTGDELVPSFDTASPGKVRDVNQMVLKGLLAQSDCDVVYSRLVKDEIQLVETALLEAVEAADLVVTSGASSMGKMDVMPDLLEKHSGEGLIFHGLNIKPGKPVGLALVKGKPVLALPGNPVSSAMTFVVVGEAIIARLTGQDLERDKVNGILEKSCSSQEGKTTFIPVRTSTHNGTVVAKPIFGKSGLISILAAADGFVTARPNEHLLAGSVVSITLF